MTIQELVTAVKEILESALGWAASGIDALFNNPMALTIGQLAVGMYFLLLVAAFIGQLLEPTQPESQPRPKKETDLERITRQRLEFITSETDLERITRQRKEFRERQEVA